MAVNPKQQPPWETSQQRLLEHSPRYEMRQTHMWLTQHFSSLHDARKESGRPVYLLEHGLSSTRILELTQEVSDDLKMEPDLAGEWWRARYLPLLVVATETGYSYEGNGTDYWPLLATSLAFDFDFHQRRIMSEYFAQCRSTFNCIAPPNTDWARSFCHIAWPIANAVLPLDMRFPFVEAISYLNRDVRDLSDDDLLNKLRHAKVHFRSQRYESWLETGNIAADLARDLLGGNGQTAILYDTVLKRIHHDLEKDASAYKALRSARRRQRILSREQVQDGALTERAKKRANITKGKPTKVGRFFLRKTEISSFEMVGEIPPPPKSSGWLERSVRSGLWRPQPWGLPGETCLTPSEVLFSTPFKIPLRSLLAQKGEPAFFQDWSKNGPDRQEAEWLENVSFDYRLPLVFTPEDETFARQRMQRFVSDATLHWVVVAGDTDTDELPEGVVQLGRMGSLKVCQTDTHFLQASGWLESIGISAPTAVSWSWLATPSLGGYSSPTYAIDDFLAINIHRINGQGEMELIIQTPDRKTDASISLPGVFPVPTGVPGSYRVQLMAQGSLLDSWSFDVVPDVFDCWDRPLCDINLSGSDYSTTALINHQLALHIATMRPLLGLELEIKTDSGDAPVRLRIPESPASLGPTHPIWDRIISDNTRLQMARGGNITLGVRVGKLGEQRWLLENETARIHWYLDDDGPPRATTDESQLETVCWPLHQILEPCDAVKPSVDEPTLWVAMDNNLPLFESSGLIVSPTMSSMETSLPPRPSRLLRQLAGQKETIGLKHIMEMYLCLSNARPTNLIAAFHGSGVRQLLKHWLLEACCGSRWVKKLQQQDEICKKRPIDVLIDCAIENNAGFVPGLHEEVKPSVALLESVKSGLLHLLPSRWWRLPTFPFGNNDGERCDEAFARAYANASDTLAAVNPAVAHLWKTASPFTDIDVWRRVFQKTCEQLNGSVLAELLFPFAGGDFLLAAPVEGVALDDLSQLLVDWLREFLPSHRSSEAWTAERFKVCLAVFLQTQMLCKVAWEFPFNAFVTDRLSARAIAFVAWRVSQIENLANFDLSEKAESDETS